MKTLVYLFFFMTVLSIGLNGQKDIQTNSANDGQKILSVVEGNNFFSFDIFSKSEKKNENLLISPYSISSALAIMYAGARTKTEKQMSDVLYFSQDQKSMHSEFKILIDSLAKVNKNGLDLKTANSLWIQKDYNLLKDYLDLVNKYYKTGVKKTDFKNQTEKSRLDINKWVEIQTKNKIKELLKPNILSQSTKLVIINAIYFNGTWDVKFDKKFTKNDIFLTEENIKKEVPFMNITGQYKYLENEYLQLLDMPYKGKNVSMIIILPKKNEGLTLMEEFMNWKQFEDVRKNMVYHKVKISLPKFNLTSELELKNTLSIMGMADAFGKEADFSGITGNKDLMIDKVIHKTFISVNESGTEAAASTAILNSPGSGSTLQKQVEFKANHPFVFILKSNSTHCILFIGRVTNPSEK